MKTTSTFPTGTSLQDEMKIAYTELVRILGEPREGDGYKVDAEWWVETPYGVGTIYNYKDGKNYNGDEGLELEEITNWHIGGSNKATAGYIRGYLSAKLS